MNENGRKERSVCWNGENFHYTGRSYDTCKREVQNKKITITSSCWFVTNTCPSFWSKLLTSVKKGANNKNSPCCSQSEMVVVAVITVK